MTMADDIPSSARPAYKKRSSSISAPACASLETIISPPSEGDTPESGTPGYRRRKPATRSQSARITGPRSVRRKPQPPPPTLQDSRGHCTSEPRLNDSETPPPQKRRGSQRRPMHNSATPRKSNAFLDVPQINLQHLQIDDQDDDDNIRLRTFSSSKQGVVNRGDSFRRRRSRSNSLAPVSPVRAPVDEVLTPPTAPIESYCVFMIGAPGVGKGALLSQFRSSECINAYDTRESPGEQNISIILNGEESELKFVTDSMGNKDEMLKADAFLVVYSVVDKATFSRADQLLNMLHDMDVSRSRPTILVANKIDLARSRAVSSQDGKCLACTHKIKFIEVSVAINHNVDELLAGILSQIRLKREQSAVQGIREPSSAHWYKNRSVVRASMKARQMITWVFGKEDSKFKNCENLQVL
ncbi:GTP-binding protein RAD isoform X2 [Anopheles arabiensis]|uniref:AGAP005243-PA n=6 Tax=gambiae species complex TaxID=44542 RepID=Q7Q9G7_ANOGA|nr:GTP-binding protein RAD isoform X2 [Anopheles arabiensis]XP_040218993.1 GTP-binding protein RAD isoform X2 [Anopheles coluzzii]XP_041768206.1 GTP-binding protein RAD isoform X1 [Anopheles merus]XP_061508604.1 GTP-binding protein RAD isoform X2 [Anopheles gambiae]XP_061508606.1 GTP-binding protein RAD isoform X2 [Anopheles gambiae]XP_314147.4 GTP-binding protein RAD isoform X2 [Anopheles gambiae]EAA09351.4 AGAP005243-PA [Anopheles gambiae str. PEST]